MRKVNVRRWEVWGAFVAIGAAAAVMGFFLQRSINTTRAAVAANRRLSASNREAIAAINRFRRQRVRETGRTDLILCRATNQVREINNRDRRTLLRASSSTAAAFAAARKIESSVADDPGALTIARYLDAILRAGIASSRHEVSVRPELGLVDCRELPSLAGKAAKSVAKPKH